MANLIATKSMRYATRRLLPGDEFVANNRDARLLIAVSKAKSSSGAAEPPKKPAKKAKPKAAPKKDRDSLDHDLDGRKGGAITPEAMAKLRAHYLEVVGKKPFGGWDAVELQRRIDEAQAS